MSDDEKLDGARNAFSFFYAYLNAVAQDIGMERAEALSSMVDETMGAARGRMIRENTGLGSYDARSATAMAMNAIKDGFGINSQVVEVSPNRVAVRCGRCPIFEAARSVGLETETVKGLCKSGPLRFMDAMVKQLNPNLRYELVQFRAAADDFCEEAVIMG